MQIQETKRNPCGISLTKKTMLTNTTVKLLKIKVENLESKEKMIHYINTEEQWLEVTTDFPGETMEVRDNGVTSVNC